MTEPTTKTPAATPKPSAPEIRCTCGESFDSIKALEEHARLHHKK